jgi:hypothetical protein
VLDFAAKLQIRRRRNLWRSKKRFKWALRAQGRLKKFPPLGTTRTTPFAALVISAVEILNTKNSLQGDRDRARAEQRLLKAVRHQL